jgi:methyl-accepting chemotaxis protein
MSIAKRLYLAVSAALAGLLLVGTVNYIKLNSVFDTVNWANAKTVPTVLVLGKLIDEFGQLRAHVSSHVLSVDHAGKTEIGKKILSDRVNIETQLKNYETRVSGIVDSKHLEELRAAIKAYLDHATKVLEFSQVNLFDEARSQIVNGALLEDKLRDTLVGHIQLNEELAKTTAEEGRSEVSSAIWITIPITLLLVLVVGTLGYLITRSLVVQLKEAVHVSKAVATGDLTSRIKVTTNDETGQLMRALQEMNESLLRIVGQVYAGTGAIADAARGIASGNKDLSERTERQATALEETASSMEELTSTIKENTENAQRANQLALSASQVAGKGGAAVSQVVATMGSINESAKKIVDIIGLIDAIAFQTNILALNAAVEAARAGDQGRGFAVVASEVRNLAQRSAAAAKEIKELIGDSVNKVNAGSKLVNEAGAIMNEIVDSSRQVTHIVALISSASQEQRLGIEQVNQAIAQMDSTTQQNAALVEQAAAAADSMNEQAAKLTQMVSVFKFDTDSKEPEPQAATKANAPSFRDNGKNKRRWTKSFAALPS